MLIFLSELYAKHWCALLESPDSAFAQCHSVVDPEMYYKVQQNHCLSLNLMGLQFCKSVLSSAAMYIC